MRFPTSVPRDPEIDAWWRDTCKYELVAFGPVFPEQSTLELHRSHRDRIAPLEAALAELLKQRGFTVVGKHGRSGTPDPGILEAVRKAFDAEFLPPIAG